MYAYEKFKEEVKKSLEKVTGKSIPETSLSIPPDPKWGDLSSSIAFSIGKKEKKSPKDVAEEIVKKIEPSGFIGEIKTAGPYINFYINADDYKIKVLEESLEEDYGSSDFGKGKNITIDFSSPNIAKPFTVGHLRSTIIGQALYNINEYLGFKCIGINHLGDWGTQFGKLIVAYKTWGNKEVIEKDPIKELLKLYTKFHEEAKKNSELGDKAREEFKKLEEGGVENKKLWEWFKDISLKKFEELYDILGVKFDKYEGEAQYALAKKTEEVVKEVLDKKIAIKEEDGSIVVPLEKFGMTNCLIQKSDGTTLYSTRDIAAAEDRWEQYQFYKNIYVVGEEQKLHFQQFFKVLELLGYPWAKDCVHLPFGLVILPGVGKMSTREGKVIFLEDLIDKAIKKIEKIIEEKNPNLENKKEVAKMVGIGAIKFADLSQNMIKEVVFDWDKMLSFEGDTGPYLQYAYVRCNSILGKLGEVGEPNASQLKEPEEIELIKKIAEFPEIVKAAGLNYEIHSISQYLLDLTHVFSDFYEKCPVIKAENEGLKAARAGLVKATKNVLKIGLNLLGINVPDKM